MYKSSIKYGCASKIMQRPVMSKIYFDRKGSRYIATNGHILLIESTTDTEPTGDACGVNDINDILSIDRLLQAAGDNTELLTIPAPAKDDKIVNINVFEALSVQYLNIIRRFAGKDCKFYYKLGSEGTYKPYSFKSADGLRFGLIMPIRQGLVA